MDPVTMFEEGGPFMYLVLATGAVLPITILLLPISLGFRVRVPAALWTLIGTLPLLAGLVGTLVGMSLTVSAAGHAPLEMKEAMSAAGLSVSMYTTIAGATASGAGFAAFSVASGLGLAIRPGRDAVSNPVLCAVGAILAVIGAVAALFSSGPGAACGVFAAGVGLALAALRFSDRDDVDSARVATGRVATGLYGAIGILSFALASASTSSAAYYFAQARASAEIQATMMAMAAEYVGISAASSGALVFFVAIATAMVAGPTIRFVDSRGWISAAATALALLPAVGLLGITASTYIDLAHTAVPWTQQRLLALTIDLPQVDDGPRFEAIMHRPTLSFTASGVELDGSPFDPGTDPRREQRVNIEAAGDVPLSRVREALDALRAREIAITVGEGELLGVPFYLPPGPPGDSGVQVVQKPATVGAKWTDEGWTLYTNAQGTELVATTVPTGEISERIATLRTRLPEADQDFEVWFSDGATVDDLVGFRAAISVVGLENGMQSLVPDVVWLSQERQILPTGMEDDEPVDDPGEMDAEIREVLAESAAQIQYCYQRELTKHPELVGRVELTVSVGPDGRVMTAKVSNSTLGNPAVEGCIRGQFLRMVFPPSDAVRLLRLPYEFAPK